MGGKNGGVFNVVLGVVMLVIAYFVPVTAPYLVPAGVSMIAGGVVQMLTPVPKGPGNTDGPDNKPSYTFSGAVNTQAQGNPVPLLYGRMIVGSAVVSAGISAEDYSPDTPGVDTGKNLPSNPRSPYDEVLA